MTSCFAGDRSKKALASTIGDICHSIGFFYVVNHAISDDICRRYLLMTKKFFALPESVKTALDKTNSPHYRGWERLGSELTNNQIDYREQLDLGVDSPPVRNPDPYYLRLIGPNQWPNEADLPGFRSVVEDFFGRLSSLAKQLLQLMSLSLDLPENSLQTAFGHTPSPYLKLIKYPPGKSGLQGVGRHKDSGFLTLLLQDEVAGLEVKPIMGDWIEIPPLSGSLVVNIGELLQVMTRNYFVATPHRVMNTAKRSRYSSAFFYSPDLNTQLTPLSLSTFYVDKVKNSPSHREAGLMASRKEMAMGIDGMASAQIPDIFGYKYWQRWTRSYPRITEKYHADVIERSAM